MRRAKHVDRATGPILGRKAIILRNYLIQNDLRISLEPK